MRITTFLALACLLGLSTCGDRFSIERDLKDEASQTTQDYADYAAQKAKEYSQRAEDAYDATKAKSQEYTERAKDYAQDVAQKASGAYQQAKETVQSAGEKAREVYAQTAEIGREMYRETEDVVKNVLDSSTERVKDTYSKVRERASDLIDRGADAIYEARNLEPEKLDYSNFHMHRAQDLNTYLIGRFIEGFLYGVMDVQYHDLHGCLTDIGTAQTELYLAIKDFETQSFEGARYAKAYTEVLQL